MQKNKPKRKLKNINVFEVSFVDKAANGQKFLVFKRLSEGGDDMNTNIEKYAGSNGNGSERLIKLSEMLEEENKDKKLVMKEGEEKIKVDVDDSDQVDQFVELKKEVESLKCMIEDISYRLPIRKGLQETEEPRSRRSPKDKAVSLFKSRELRAKMTHAASQSPTQWAKELLQDD